MALSRPRGQLSHAALSEMPDSLLDKFQLQTQGFLKGLVAYWSPAGLYWVTVEDYDKEKLRRAFCEGEDS